MFRFEIDVSISLFNLKISNVLKKVFNHNKSIGKPSKINKKISNIFLNSNNSKLFQNQLNSNEIISNFLPNGNSINSNKNSNNSISNNKDNNNNNSYAYLHENENLNINSFNLALDFKEVKISQKKDTNEIFDLDKTEGNFLGGNNQFTVAYNEFFNFNIDSDFQGDNFIHLGEFNHNMNQKDNFETDNIPNINFITNTFNNEFKEEDYEIEYQNKFIKQEDNSTHLNGKYKFS